MGASHGAHLKAPVHLKHVDDGDWVDDKYLVRWGSCAQQGWRRSMEDAVSVYTQRVTELGLLVFGVYDGHGGSNTSHYCADVFARELSNGLEAYWRSGKLPSERRAETAELDKDNKNKKKKNKKKDKKNKKNKVDDQPKDETQYEKLRAERVPDDVFVEIFLDFDWSLCTDKAQEGRHMGCGTTVSICVVDVRSRRVYVMHLGDSKAIVFLRNGQLVYETRDHAPWDEEESKRIQAAAKTPTSRYTQIELRNNRVFVAGSSSLNVCRGFGDHDFKRVRGLRQSQQAVSALPEVRMFEFPKKQTLSVLLASDGIWGAEYTGDDKLAESQQFVVTQVIVFTLRDALSVPAGNLTRLPGRTQPDAPSVKGHADINRQQTKLASSNSLNTLANNNSSSDGSDSNDGDNKDNKDHALTADTDFSQPQFARVRSVSQKFHTDKQARQAGRLSGISESDASTTSDSGGSRPSGSVKSSKHSKVKMSRKQKKQHEAELANQLEHATRYGTSYSDSLSHYFDCIVADDLNPQQEHAKSSDNMSAILVSIQPLTQLPSSLRKSLSTMSNISSI